MPRGGTPGNKGGGRKSKYQEQADAQSLDALWNDNHTEAGFKETLKENRSIKNMFIMAGLKGKEKVMIEIFKKLYPDKHYISGEINVLDNLTDKELDDRNKELEKRLSENKDGDDKEGSD